MVQIAADCNGVSDMTKAKTAAIDFSKFVGAEDTEQFKSVARVNKPKQERTLKQILLDNMGWRFDTAERKHNWSTRKGGLVAFHLKSGATALTLPNGKTTMVVDEKEFPEVVKALVTFTEEGGFDEQLAALEEKHKNKLSKAAASRAARIAAEDESEEEQEQLEEAVDDTSKGEAAKDAEVAEKAAAEQEKPAKK